jgi:hypothetical protein
LIIQGYWEGGVRDAEKDGWGIDACFKKHTEVLGGYLLYMVDLDKTSKPYPILWTQRMVTMSQLPTTTTTANTPTDTNRLTSGTNHFFGFLIPFIAFLFIFLSLGVGVLSSARWRRYSEDDLVEILARASGLRACVSQRQS